MPLVRRELGPGAQAVIAKGQAGSLRRPTLHTGHRALPADSAKS